MNTDIINFIDSIINFCKSVLEMPIHLYTWGLEVCPWVSQWIDYFNNEYGINITDIVPKLQEIIEQLKMIG